MAAWVLLQVGDLVLENIEAPAWVIQVMMLVVALGFIAALIIAWAYELTPEGIKRERDVERGQSIMHETGRKLDRIVMAFLLVAVAYFAVDKFVLDPARSAKPVLAEPPIIDTSTPVAGFSGRAAIAVIPFVNMSNDPEQEYFADGITEDLITGLQSFQSFPIIARTSTFKYKGTSPDVREIAAALGAGYIVEGQRTQSQ